MSEIYWSVVKGLAKVAGPIAAVMAVLGALLVAFLTGVAIAVTVFGDVKLGG